MFCHSRHNSSNNFRWLPVSKNIFRLPDACATRIRVATPAGVHPAGIEMSFVEQEDVLVYTEAMFIELVKTLYPHKKITQTPFPRFKFAETMQKYGSDKPDLRENKNNPDELAFAWITDFPMFEKKDDGSIAASHHPFCSIHPEDKEKFMKGRRLIFYQSQFIRFGFKRL